MVINAIRWKDSSKIVTLFCRTDGRIKVIVKGALRKNSPYGGIMETLNLVDTIITDKASRSLQIVADAELVHDFKKIRSVPEQFAYAMAILEVINQLFEASHSETAYFDYLITVLQEMEYFPDPETVFWYFLLKTSSFLGFKPEFSRCQACGKELLNEESLFSLNSGISSCIECGEQDVSTVVLSASERNFLLKLQSFPHRNLRNLNRPEIKTDFTSLLVKFLNYHLDKQIHLNSLAFLA
ncbi:MAG: DNA repair protein RecO [Calditrichaceae bacterium]|nr:DNA repair protein RecO [Calditrichaceae bacterium]MBN2710274.1 DNA repair protein RecO [Calditrichaceae bacterium]